MILIFERVFKVMILLLPELNVERDDVGKLTIKSQIPQKNYGPWSWCPYATQIFLMLIAQNQITGSKIFFVR